MVVIEEVCILFDLLERVCIEFFWYMVKVV